MKNVMNAMLFGFKEILNWNTMKYALLIGISITVLWVGIGYLIWDQLIALSSKILEFVPFAMARSNGAWMLSTFLWFQMVVMTVSLIFIFFGNVILRKVSKDNYTLTSLAITVGASAFWALVWFFKGDYIYQAFLKLLTWLPFETLEKGLAFFIAFYLLYNAIIITTIFMTTLFSEPLIVSIEERHYEDDEVQRDNVINIIGYTLKDSLLFGAAFIVALPILFIPVLNVLLQTILWVYLIKDTVTYDAASMVYEKVDTKEIKKNRFSLWTISIVTALFNFIPGLHMFGPLFGEASMFHYLKSIQKES